MNKSKLSVIVYERTGFPLEPDDPAFVLVELNRVALEDLLDEGVKRVAERLDSFPERIAASGAAVAAKVSSQGAQSVSQMLTEARRSLAADTEQAQRRVAEHAATLSEPLSRQVAAAVRAAQAVSRAGSLLWRWLFATAAFGAVLFGVGFVSGQAAGPDALYRLISGG